jgi:hypothetical protein
MSERILRLKSGRKVKIKLPPLTQAFMEQVQRLVIEAALIEPKEFKHLTPDERGDLFVQIQQANTQYWIENARKMADEATAVLMRARDTHNKTEYVR